MGIIPIPLIVSLFASHLFLLPKPFSLKTNEKMKEERWKKDQRSKEGIINETTHLVKWDVIPSQRPPEIMMTAAQLDQLSVGFNSSIESTDAFVFAQIMVCIAQITRLHSWYCYHCYVLFMSSHMKQKNVKY